MTTDDDLLLHPKCKEINLSVTKWDKEKKANRCVITIKAASVRVYLYVVLGDLDLGGVDVVHQQAQGPPVHLLYPHSLRSALCHLTCGRCQTTH